MDMKMDKIKKRIQVALGEIPADIVVKNGQIINVFTSDIMKGDIAICDGVIAGIGTYDGYKSIDATNKYIVPGLIDGHMHIESTMLTPQELSKVLIRHGVTTIMADPHEIGNVAGNKGIQYMLDSSEGLGVDMYFLMPSCVPATCFENTGAELKAEEIQELYSHKRVLGLAEVMNFEAIKNRDESMLSKLLGAEGKTIDGHGAGLSGRNLNAYISTGIYADHECDKVEEAIERLALGMYLMIREGTAARNLKALLPAVTPKNSRRCIFVTDDKLLDDLIEEGSVDHNIRLAIKEGLDPITAIQMATINTAEFFGLREKGAIAPGYQADLVILKDLNNFEIENVIKAGTLLLQHKDTHSEAKIQLIKGTKQLPNINIGAFEKENLLMRLTSDQCNVIEIIPNSLITKHRIEKVCSINGKFVTSIEKDQLKLAVIERHHATGNVGLGIVKGFGIQKGAIASSIAHDSHNIVVVGTTDEDMYAAVKQVEKMNGGLVIVSNGKVLAEIQLNVAGLMSDDHYENVLSKLKELRRTLKIIGARMDFDPFLTLSFQALPVIPELKLTDMGLFSFEKFCHIGYQA